MEHLSQKQKSVEYNMLFNTIGTFTYFATQWLLTVFVVRLSGFENAGFLSLAISVTAAPATIGLFNMRSYQASDLSAEYTDHDYIYSRVVTNVLSFFICGLIVFIYRYQGINMYAILAFMVFRIIEGTADVYYGIEQKKQRMDHTGISMATRGILGLVVFSILISITQNIIISILGMSFISLLIILFYDYRVTKRLIQSKQKLNSKSITSLLQTCFPLALVSFFTSLSLMLPRIYLERYHGPEIMGIFFSLTSPAIIIQLAAITIFAPLVPTLTRSYNTRDFSKIKRDLKRFLILFVGASIVVLLGAIVLGRIGLILLFGSGIEPYTYLLIPIILISILIALSASLASICTIIRAIKQQYFIGIIGIVVAFVTSLTLVKDYVMRGALVSLALVMVLQIIVQLIIIITKVRRDLR